MTFPLMPMAIAKIKSLCLALAILLIPIIARAEPNREIGIPTFIIDAEYFDDALWILDADGNLTRINASDKIPNAITTSRKLVDICVANGEFFAISVGEDEQQSVKAEILRNSHLVPFRTFQLHNEMLLEANCQNQKLRLITTKRLITFNRYRTVSVDLSRALRRGLRASYLQDEYLYIGANRGEWGGGLERINIETGEIAKIENETGYPCVGLLVSGCDPVNGITHSNRREGCIVVAVGLIHMFSKGRLVEVCGTQISEYYSRTYSNSEIGIERNPNESSGTSTSFFGVVNNGTEIIAVGVDGIYKINPRGSVSITNHPEFVNYNGVYANFDDPNYVLVLTTINQSHSMSGATPLLVLRQ